VPSTVEKIMACVPEMSNAPSYVVDTAVEHISALTGCPELVVRTVLQAQLRYEVLLGISPAEILDDRAFDVEAERKEHADLLPQDCRRERRVIWELEVCYVLRTTDVAPDAIGAVLAGQVAHMIDLGLMEHGALEAYQAWARHRLSLPFQERCRVESA